VFEIHEGASRPELLPQLVPRHQLARPAEQQTKNPARLLLQPGSHAVVPQLAGGDVQDEWAARKNA